MEKFVIGMANQGMYGTEREGRKGVGSIVVGVPLSRCVRDSSLLGSHVLYVRIGDVTHRRKKTDRPAFK